MELVIWHGRAVSGGRVPVCLYLRSPLRLVGGFVLSVRGRGPATVGRTVGWPVFLAIIVIGLAIAPMVMRMHFATVTGTGSDAHMAAGSANFLQHAYPTSVDPRLPLDRMP